MRRSGSLTLASLVSYGQVHGRLNRPRVGALSLALLVLAATVGVYVTLSTGGSLDLSERDPRGSYHQMLADALEGRRAFNHRPAD